jgi:hypothetical protein
MKTDPEILREANVEDESTGDAFEQFSFPKVGGQRGSILVPRAHADDARELLKVLKTRNAHLPRRHEAAEGSG